MAWTNPKTWAFQEGLTSANFNLHIRDNLLALGPHLIARKSSDQTVNNSTTLQNDNTLVLAIGANEVWRATWDLIWSSSNVADIKVAWTFPTGCSVGYSIIMADPVNAVTWYKDFTGTSPTASAAFSGQGALLVGPVPLEVQIVNGSTAGNVTLQWAQNTAEVSNTIVKTNSTLWAVKLA